MNIQVASEFDLRLFNHPTFFESLSCFDPDSSYFMNSNATVSFVKKFDKFFDEMELTAFAVNSSFLF